MDAEEGRKWARKGDDGWWSAISEAAPWAGVKFILTKERDAKYRGTYVTGYPEDDPVQLQDVLQDATGFRILSPFESDDGTREFPVNDLQTVAQKCGHFLFLLESLAEVLQIGDKPSPVLVRISLFGWPPQQNFSSYYVGRNSTPEERQVLETAERRALRAVRLIVEAAKSSKLNCLRVLRLNGVGLDDAGIQALLDVITAGHLHSLTSLSLGANPFGSTSAIALAHVLESGKLLRLKVLALTYSCLGDDACEAYEKAMSSGSLEALSELHFQQNDVGDRGAQALARGFQSGRVKNLTKLSLGWNRIGDDGMVALATSLAAGRFLELRILDFRGNSFGAKGIQLLARVLESGNLNSLLKLSIENGKRLEEAAEPLVAALSVNRKLTVDLSFDESRWYSILSRLRKQLVERNRQYVAVLAQAGRNLVPAFTSDPGDGDDWGQQQKKTADSSISSQHGSLVTHHFQGPRKEQVRVSIGDTVADGGIDWARNLSKGRWSAISEASSWARGQFQLTKERDGQCEEVSSHSEDDLAQLQGIFQDATSTLEAEEGRKWEDDPLELHDKHLVEDDPPQLQGIFQDATSNLEAEEGRKWEDDHLELQDINLVATITMEAEEGRKWAHKGDDGWWSAISETAPWAGVKFVLTKERDDKYKGKYLFGHREDDSVQLQDVLRDATNFDILPPFSSESATSEFAVDSLQMAADKCQHFLFLVKSFADVVQMGDNPAPVLLRLSISGWAKLQHFSLHYGHTPTPEEKPVFEGARKRVLQAVRLMIRAAHTGKLNKLESLALVAVGLDDAGLQAVVDVIEAGHFRSLTRLFLDANIFGSKGAIALAQAMESRKLLGLETLSLNSIGFGDDGCEAYEKAISSGSVEALRKIHLSDNDIGDRGAQALARGFQSGRVTNLAELDLSWNRVGDDGMVALATSLAAGKFCELTKLNFRWNSFGGKGIQGLTTALESGDLNSLKKLSIENWRRLEEDARPLIVAFSINKALTLDLGFDKSTCLSSQDGAFLTVHPEGSAEDFLQAESFLTAHSEGSAKDCSQDRSFATVHPDGSAKDSLQNESFIPAHSEGSANDYSQDISFVTVHPEGSAKDSLQDESFFTAHSEGSAKDCSQDRSFVTVHPEGSAKDFLQVDSFLTAPSEGSAKDCSQDRSFVTVHPEGSAKDSPHDGSFVMVRSEGSAKDSCQAEAFVVTPHPESCGKEQVWVPTGAMVSEEGRKWARKGDDGCWTAISEVAPWAGVKFTLTDEKYEGSYLSDCREDDLVQLQDILRRATHFELLGSFETESGTQDFPNDLKVAADKFEQFVFLLERLADALQTGDEPTPLLLTLSIWTSLCPPTQEMKQVLEASRLRVLLAVRLIVEAVKSGKFNKVESLYLVGVGLDDAGLQDLSDMIKADNFPSLTHLGLGGNEFGLKGITTLGQAMESSKLLGLQTLALESNELRDDGCEAFERALSSGNLEALRYLYLSANDIGDRGAQALARGIQSGRVKKLAELYLGWNRVGDDGMVALATSLAAGKCPELTELDVGYNPFSTKGIHGLAKALESGNLNSLLKLSSSNGQRSELEAEPLVMALSVNQALTVDLDFNVPEGSAKDSSQAGAFIVTPHPESSGKEQVWVPTGAMVTEEGRRWARKGDDGFWTAISEVAPWAGAKFTLTDEKYEGSYLSDYREDDLVQLQDILRRATHFNIVFERAPRDFPAKDLQVTLEQFVFLVERLADALQTGDEPTPLVRIHVWHGWLTRRPYDSLDHDATRTQKIKRVSGASRIRVLLAVRLIVEAAKSGKLNKVESLCLVGLGLDDVGLQALSDVIKAGHFPCLTHLYLGGNDFLFKGTMAFAQAMESSKLSALETLAFESNKLGDYGCEAFERALSSGSLEALRDLSFNDNYIGNRGAQALARGFQSGRVKKLANLDFSFNTIGDDGMSALATSLAAGKCPDLTELDLCWNSFGVKGIYGLAKALESGNLNSLLKLSISNGKRSEEDTKRLVMALSVNQALTVDLDFDGDTSHSELRRQHKRLVERKYVQLLARAGENFVPESSGKEQVWVPTGAMVTEEGRKWARKGDDGSWTAISEVAPWAGVKFTLTDEKYEGSYLSDCREDDLVQLQDILRRAKHFQLLGLFETKSGTQDFPNDLKVAADKFEQFVFLLERLADALQTGDEPTPLLLALAIWSSAYVPRQKMKQVLEASRLRVLLAVRLIMEAAKSGKLNKVRSLFLVGGGLDDAGLQDLSDVIKADHFPCLTHLDLGGNEFGLKGITTLGQAMESSKLLGLQTLALEQNELRDDGCEAFERALSSGNLEALRGLHFSDNDIGDRGAQALARGIQSGRVKKLAELSLTWNRVGDDGMVALATSLAAGKCPELTKLDVGYNPFSAKGIHGLAKALESGNLNSLFKLSISNGKRSEVDAKPLVMALSVNQALTVDLEFDSGWFTSGLFRQHKRLLERNSKYVQLLAQTEAHFVPASFAKVYLCGNPEVGKTTLRKSITKSYLKSLLSRERKDREEPRTRGIEISKLKCRGGKDDKRDICLAFWDMAGQDEYHKLHSSFLSDLTDGKATIFVVVCTTQNIEKAEEELNYWLRFIASSVHQNVKSLRDVFVVVNRWGRNLKFNVKEWKHMVLTLSLKFQVHLNIKVDPFIVDVRKKAQVDCVVDALVEHSREMLDDEMIPEICHFIQTDLNNWGETTRSFPVLSRAEFDQVLNKRGAKWDDLTIEAALVYLNEVGVLIYINKEFPPEWYIPNKLVVLEPNWFCREIVGNMFLTRDMGGERGDLFRSKVNTKTGSILITLFKDHFQALLGLWDEINFHDVLTILLWVGFCYKGHNENLFIPALIDEDDTPGDCWYGGNLGADTGGQWVMGYCVEHAPDEKCLATIALWHKFQVRLAQTSEFNDQYGGSDFVCGKYFVTFKARLMCVLVEVNAEKKRPTFDHIEVFVKPLLNCQMDDLDSNTRKQCQVDLASEVVEMLLDLWTQVCPGINSIQRVVWPWPSCQPRRPKANLVNDMEAASINKWVQEHGVGRILQRLVGGTPISGDQLLSTTNKKRLLLSMEGNIQGGKSRLEEAMTLGIISSDLMEGVDLNEE